MSGRDVRHANRKRRGTKFHTADASVEAGRLGQKTGAGYYRYEPGSRTPIPDPETTCVIESRSEEHTSELQSLMRISYAVFCLKKKKTQSTNITTSVTQHMRKNNTTNTPQ